jgi:hypothetical protein
MNRGFLGIFFKYSGQRKTNVVYITMTPLVPGAVGSLEKGFFTTNCKEGKKKKCT